MSKSSEANSLKMKPWKCEGMFYKRGCMSTYKNFYYILVWTGCDFWGFTETIFDESEFKWNGSLTNKGTKDFPTEQIQKGIDGGKLKTSMMVQSAKNFHRNSTKRENFGWNFSSFFAAMGEIKIALDSVRRHPPFPLPSFHLLLLLHQLLPSSSWTKEREKDVCVLFKWNKKETKQRYFALGLFFAAATMDKEKEVVWTIERWVGGYVG